jgi:hypothetical protein
MDSQKKKYYVDDILEENKESSHNDLEENDPSTVKTKKSETSSLRCENCNINRKSLIMKCFTCNKIICTNCVENSHMTSKKRDKSLFICSNCIDQEAPKLR